MTPPCIRKTKKASVSPSNSRSEQHHAIAMDTWHIFLGTILFAIPLILLLPIFRGGKTGQRRLPPGPPAIPVLGSVVWLTDAPADVELLLRRLFVRYGPIVSLRVGSRLLYLF